MDGHCPASILANVRWTDYALLTILVVFLCGADAISGRPLPLHEARLPQTSREMMRSGNWLIPTSGGRPWLERPPLPHWLTGLAAELAGSLDDEGAMRAGSILAGMAAVLLLAWMAAVFYGRVIGLL